MQLTQSHRLRGLALVLALATPLALAAPVRPLQGQTGATIKVLSYNAMGAARKSQTIDRVDPDSTQFVDVLAKRIAAEQPQLVGLQEMCGSQVNYLEVLLAQRGYPMVAHFDFTNPKDEDRCPARPVGSWPPQKVGKAVLAVGTITVLLPGDQVDVCLRWEERPVPIRFCSVHTGPDRIPTVAQTVTEWATQGAVIVVGDFNAPPTDLVMNLMYKDSQDVGDFFEADWADDHCEHIPGTTTTRCGEPTFPRFPFVEKIDYIFADAGYFARDGMRAWVEDTAGQCHGKACSDHYMLWGDVPLREQPPDPGGTSPRLRGNGRTSSSCPTAARSSPSA